MTTRKSGDREGWLRDTRPEDFDGHRDFRSWTPEQRLDWLGQVIAFVCEHRGAAKKRER